MWITWKRFLLITIDPSSAVILSANSDASSYFHVSQRLSRTKDAIDYLDHDRAKVVIVIPPNFMKSIRADRETQMQIIIDGSDPTFGNIIRGYITAFTEQYNQKLLLSFLNRQGLEQIKPPVDGRIRIWFNEDLESRNFIIPGIIAVIIMIVGALLTSLIIAREYENGTMETIKSMPVKAGELLLGKAIPYFFIGLTNVLIAILLGQLLFGIVMKGNFWLMILSASLYLSVALSLGLWISNHDKITIDGQPNSHFNDLPAVASSFQFCFSGNQYAEIFAIANIGGSGKIFYRYFIGNLSA